MSHISREARFFTGSFGPDSIGLIKVAEDGSMTHTCLSAQEDAAYLSFDRERSLLYALSESNDLRKSILNVYRWNGEQLSLLTSRQLGAIGACHITHSSNALLLSYYSDGAAELFWLDQDGLPEENSAFVLYQQGSGPMPQQNASHIHWGSISQSSNYSCEFLLIDLGNDTISRYLCTRLSSESESELSCEMIFAMPPGSGPRHAVVDNKSQLLYVLTELSSELYVIDTSEDLWRVQVKYDLRSNEKCGDSWAGAIKSSQHSDLLFCSSRGDDTIRTFSVSSRIPSELRPWPLGKLAAEHSYPRDLQHVVFTSAEYLLLANQNSNTISQMRIDRKAEKLYETTNSIYCFSPVCIIPAE